MLRRVLLISLHNKTAASSSMKTEVNHGRATLRMLHRGDAADVDVPNGRWPNNPV